MSDIILVCASVALVVFLAAFELGKYSGRRSGAALGRARLQPQLDQLKRARDVEFDAVLRFANEWSAKQGTVSPSLIRLFNLLCDGEHRK